MPLKGKGFVVGIRNYLRDPLENTVRDATAIAATLERIGFDEVKLLTDDVDGVDFSFLGIQDAIQDFVASVDENTVVVFAFMGASHFPVPSRVPRPAGNLQREL